MLKLFLTACAVGLSLSAAGVAQAQIQTRPGQVVGELRHSDLEWLLTQGGHRIVEQGEPSEMMIDAETQEGFKFRLTGQACSGEGKAKRCEGLTLIASWGLDDGDVGKVAPVIEAFNRDYAAAKVFTQNGSAIMERYVIVTGGVSVQQLETELDVFLGLADEFWIKIDQATAD